MQLQIQYHRKHIERPEMFFWLCSTAEYLGYWFFNALVAYAAFSVVFSNYLQLLLKVVLNLVKVRFLTWHFVLNSACLT